MSQAALRTGRLAIGGRFVRATSGQESTVHDADGQPLASLAQAGDADVRAAVGAARSAAPGWAATAPSDRARQLFTLASQLDEHRDQLTEELVASTGSAREAAARQVVTATDRLAWYAGWSDKLPGDAQDGPTRTTTTARPMGTVGLVAPQDDPLLGLIDPLGAVLAAGNTVVVVASARFPLPAVTLAEVVALSPLPGGVVNVVTGPVDAAATALAAAGTEVVDLLGLAGQDVRAIEQAAAPAVRVLLPPAGEPDFSEPPSVGPGAVTRYMRSASVWQPQLG